MSAKHIPPISQTGDSNYPDVPNEPPKIKKYHIIKILAQGGMGVVYLAEQIEPVKRKVAIKVIKPGMDSKQVLARFKAEQQALALLDHPNIAHIFGGGVTKSGRSYFVMELVEGQPITEYCDQQKLSIEDRLELFKQVCEAVQYAHQKGIIHRDIKPSNVLVSVQAGKPTPMIIDFGVAKAISQPLTERTFFTEQGQFIGTPEYMSPEQAGMPNQDIDTRSDIYSLGILLYELLAGILPFDAEIFRQAALDETLRIIRNEDPPLPSSRLANLGNEAKNIAEKRSTQITTLTRRLHKELEWIPLKAMRKDPDRRYKTVSELADDIQNYLNGNPLIAGPESATYRFRKVVKRHKGLFTGIAAVLAVLIAGIVTSMIFAIGQQRARFKAQEQEIIAEENAEEYRRALYFNKIQLADKELASGSFYHANQLLNSCPNELRSWEWYHLQYVSYLTGMTLCEYSGTIAMFSPDGRIISLCSNQGIELFDAETGLRLKTIKVRCSSVAFSPDGRRIISCRGKTIEVWDVNTGSLITTIITKTINLTSTFSMNGDHLISASKDGTITSWDTVTGKELTTFRIEVEREIDRILFNPSGERFIVLPVPGGKSGLKVYSTSTGTMLLSLTSRDYVFDAAFSSDSRYIVYSTAWKIQVYNVLNRTKMTEFTFKSILRSVAFDPNGRYIASGHDDGKVRFWDLTNDDKIPVIYRHNTKVHSVAFSPDSKQIVSCGRRVHVWRMPGIERARIAFKHPVQITSMTVSPNGRYIGAISTNGLVTIWDNITKAEKKIPGKSWMDTLAFSRDNRCIILSSRSAINEDTLHFWDLIEEKELKVFNANMACIEAASISKDGKRLIVCGQATPSKGMISIFNIENGAIIRSLGIPRVGLSAIRVDGNRILLDGVSAFSVDGNYVALFVSKSIQIWDIKKGAMVQCIQTEEIKPRCLAFSSDGKYIVSGTEKGEARIWEVVTGKTSVVFDHGAPIVTVAFSRDGNRVATGSQDARINIWDTQKGSKALTLEAQSAIDALVFSPDGIQILTGLHDGTIRVWNSVSRGKSRADVLRIETEQSTSEPKKLTNVKRKLKESIRIQDLKTSKSTYMEGEEIAITYKIVNQSDTRLDIPLNTQYSIPMYLIGTLQAWIEPLDENAMTTDFGRASKRGARYAAGGIRLPIGKDHLVPTEQLKMNSSIHQELKPGWYKYYIEMKAIDDDSLINEEVVEFVVLPISSVTESSSLITEQQVGISVGQLAPDFTLMDLSGKHVNLADFKGKVILLDFWATWCSPCRKAIPHLEALHKKYKNQGLVVIGINHESDQNKVKEFVKGRISYIVLIDADEQFKEYGIRGIPAVFFIDGKGIIRHKDTGFGSGKEMEMEQKVKDFLGIKEEGATESKQAVKKSDRSDKNNLTADYDTSVDLNSNLVAHYPFSGHVRDISGNGNHGQVRGEPIITADRYGNEKSALCFDGEDDYIELTNESAFDLNNFTISVVFRCPGFFSDCWIISKGTHFGNFTVQINGDTRPGYASYVHQTNRGNWSFLASRQPVPKDEFIHLVITVSEDSFCSYINGQLQREINDISPPLLNDASVTIAAGGYYEISDFSVVTLDDLRVYSRAKSTGEVSRLYADLFDDNKNK